MPLIDTPFKRVAVDICGSISPLSDAGYQYILTLVDYAARYPDTVPLKKRLRLYSTYTEKWVFLKMNPVRFVYREVPQEQTGFSPFQILYRRLVRGNGTILKELWTKEVNMPEVKSSYEYITELRKCIEESVKPTQEELQKSQKCYKKHYDKKSKPRRLLVGN